MTLLPSSPISGRNIVLALQDAGFSAAVGSRGGVATVSVECSVDSEKRVLGIAQKADPKLRLP